MPQVFKIFSAREIPDNPLLISRFARGVEEPHQPFLGGRDILAALDMRESLVPPIGTTISEPGLAERWRRYDRDYRAEERLSSFWVTEIPDATVYPPFGIVARGDMLVRDTIRHSKMLSSIFPTQNQEHFLRAMGTPESAILADAPRAKRHVPGHSFLLGFGLFENYFNWTLRYASRVAMYQAMPQPCRLVVPAPIKRYVAETLEFLGVPPEQVEYLDGPVSFERLTLMSPFALGRYQLSPLITSTLREHPRLTELPRGRKRRLYIPRRNVRMRRVVNESAVEAALEALDFEVFDNSDYSVREQAKAFRDAEIIVAPHGAGLTNIVYCDASTPIIELVPEGYDQGATSYRSLADLFGLRYIQLFAQEAAPDRKGNRCNADIRLDAAELVRTVETALR